MNRVVSFSAGPGPLSHPCDAPSCGQVDPLVLVENDAPPGSAQWARSGVVQADRPATVIGDPLDAAISHIYRAGLMIDGRTQGAGGELDGAVGELDAAIRLIQAETFDTSDSLTLTTQVRHWVWSDPEDRWVGLTFCELQVWLDHPQQDPGLFASHEATS